MHHNAQYSLGSSQYGENHLAALAVQGGLLHPKTSQCVREETEIVPHNGWCLSHIPTISAHTSPMASLQGPVNLCLGLSLAMGTLSAQVWGKFEVQGS